jgi:four helix bundle protein
MARHNFKELMIWKRSIGLAKITYSALKEFPAQDANTLGFQIKKSAISISSNIAEGAGRNSDAEFHYFLGVAKGSLYELHSQIILAQELKLMMESSTIEIIAEIETLALMIQSFQEKIKTDSSKFNGAKEPFANYQNINYSAYSDFN